jgi:hypothetical protein
MRVLMVTRAIARKKCPGCLQRICAWIRSADSCLVTDAPIEFRHVVLIVFLPSTLRMRGDPRHSPNTCLNLLIIIYVGRR